MNVIIKDTRQVMNVCEGDRYACAHGVCQSSMWYKQHTRPGCGVGGLTCAISSSAWWKASNFKALS